MKVVVVTSEGTRLGTYEETDGVIRLTENDESTVWGESGIRLRRSLDHMEALKSRNLTIRSDGTFLDDGTPLTEEIIRYWGFEPILSEGGDLMGYTR